MPKRSPLRVAAGLACLAGAAWIAHVATSGPHGNTLGIVLAIGAFVGALPGAALGATHPGLRAPVVLMLGATAGALLGTVATLGWLFDGPILALFVGGLMFGGGAVSIPLVVVGCALVAFAPLPVRGSVG